MVEKSPNDTKDICKNCGAILPYKINNWPPQMLKICPSCGTKFKKSSHLKQIAGILIILCLIVVAGNLIIANDFKIDNSLVKTIFPGTTIFSQSYPKVGGYTLKGEVGSLDLSPFNNSTLNNYLSTNQPKYSNGKAVYYQQFLNNPNQKVELTKLVDEIKLKTNNNEDRARIAISFVQHIPYDTNKASIISTNPSGSYSTRYPYQVLYDRVGICSEKSLLLAYLLKELGFGVVLFSFDKENHMAVGIKSSPDYAYKSSGYAFIESTQPTIITDSNQEYVGVGKLTSNPEIIEISKGIVFINLNDEKADVKELSELNAMGSPLDSYHYGRWSMLCDKYGINPDNANKPIYR
jgi:hypothetical protein